MKSMLNGFTWEEIASLCDLWKLGKPIDVEGFLERTEIPETSKQHVIDVGNQPGTPAEKFRMMQAQVIIEVSKLVLPG